MQTEEIKQMKSDEKSISIKLPRVSLPSFQAVILMLLIVVGAFQTAQLYGLNLQIASGRVNAASLSSSPAPSNSSDPGTSSLPSMVGGC